MFTNSTQNVNNEGTSFASPIMCYAMTASPSTYPYNEDGSFSTNFPALMVPILYKQKPIIITEVQ